MQRKKPFPSAAGLPFFAARLKKGAAIALCICMLALSSCADLSFEQADISPVPLPTADTAAMTAPVGDSRARYSIRATLYYRTQDGMLSSALRLIHVDPEDDPNRLIVESLLETPYSSSGLLPIAPQATSLLSLQLSGGIATVDLSAQALSQGEEAFYIARAAIAKTLLGREDITAVNVLCEGRAAEAGGFPLGALTAQESNTSIGYRQLLSEQMLFESGGTYIEREAVLYLPASQNGPLLPVCVPVNMESKSDVNALIGECLRRMPSDVLPAELFESVAAETSITTAGERVLTIRLKSETAAYSPAERLIPALAATVCSFMPNIDLVRAYIGQETVLRAGGVESTDGLFDPDRFRALVGSSAQLFSMAEDGSLRRQEHVLAQCAPSARDLITALISRQNVFPQGTLAQDILGVHIGDNIAHVNLSSALYSMCQPLSADEERALVYAIVNTLVYNLDTVLRVQFYIDGAVADTFAGSISIRTPLMANPGIIKE